MGEFAKIVERTLVAILMVLISIYSHFISPLLGQRCRFYPCCSAYAKDALEKHGLLKGSYFTLRRLLRCHPLHPGGFDYVPEVAKEAN